MQIDVRSARTPIAPGTVATTGRWQSVITVAVVFGVVCRLSQYAANTSLWHDEAFVALNILQKGFGELLGPLDWNEPAPPGFLVLEKLVAVWLGRSEYALRLIPLLAGLAGVIAFAAVARALYGAGAAALWAVLLMGASDKLIAHANEVKHFTLDVLWAVLLSWLALRIREAKRPLGALLAWGLLSAIGPWVSYASVFVLTASILVLAPHALRHWEWPERSVYMIANFWVLGSFALLFVPIHAQLSATVLGFWASSFPDTSGVLAVVYWLGRAVLGLCNYFWQPLGVALLVLAVLGGAQWWRTDRRWELSLFTLPVLLALIAAFLHRWPFGGNQHMVFAAPALLLLVAEGMEDLRARLARQPRWVPVACVGALLLPGVGDAIFRIVVPRRRHEVRPVITFVQRHMQPGDQLLVFCPAEVEFYTGQNFRHAAQEAAPFARVWFIGTRSGYKAFPNQDLLDGLGAHRPRLQAVEEYGAAAYLFGPDRSWSAPHSP